MLICNGSDTEGTLRPERELTSNWSLFARKIGEEGEYVDFLLELCDNLIWDTEDLVRKGVGWALKDNIIGKNRKKILDYVKKLRKMGVSSTITLYAIRKIKGKERKAILSIKASK